MIDSNIDHCENSENEDIKKYANVFASVLNKKKLVSGGIYIICQCIYQLVQGVIAAFFFYKYTKTCII